LDQECLPQDDSQEQELGIQAMDIVYQRAYCSVGLFDSIVVSQGHLDAAASVLDWGMNKENRRGQLWYPLPARSYSEVASKTAQNLIEFLELLGNDPWNIRAWILQEAFSAGHRMMILIKTTPSVSFRAPGRVLEAPQLIPNTFNIIMNDIQRLINFSKEFLLSAARIPTVGSVAVSSDNFSNPGYQRAANILEKLDKLHPITSTAESWMNYVYVKGGTNYGARKICNAAVALSFLRSRSNFRPADRLAILANLCDYEIRLNTVVIENNFSSLSVCLFTLAFMNGDMSLLIPDIYYDPSIKGIMPSVPCVPSSATVCYRC
jgi:hypothetical protein